MKIGAPSRRVFVRLQVGGISRLDHATLECGDVIDFPPKVIESAHVAVWLSVSTFGYRADGNVEVVVADVAPWATPRIETFVSNPEARNGGRDEMGHRFDVGGGNIGVFEFDHDLIP